MSVVVLKDGHHVLKKLMKNQIEVYKQHMHLKNLGTTFGLGFSLLNLPPLVHALSLEDNNMHEDKDSLYSNSHS